MSNTPDPDGMIVARRFAQWHIGDPSWADAILAAYLNPDSAQRVLEIEMNDNE